jgi:hypothetical protein
VSSLSLHQRQQVNIYDCSLLTRLLRFELIQLSLLPIDLCLLCRHPPLHFFVLLLTGLHLIADESPAEKSDGGPDTGTRPGVAGGGTNDCSQTRPADSSVNGALFSSRKRLGTTDNNQRQQNCSDTCGGSFHLSLLAL